MSTLKPDEKLCPFCAETIKKAAIKCRYCSSDVPAETIEKSASRPPRAEPEPPKPEQTTPDREPATSSKLIWPLLGVLLLGAVLAVVFAVQRANADETAPDGTETSNSARAVVMQRAADSTAAILSYKASTFDADAKKAGELMTAGMRKEYLKALDPVKAKVVKEGIELKATVVASSLTHYEGDTVRALLFVNQSTTATGARNEQIDSNRVVVTMKRDQGDWLVSKLDPF